MKAEELGGGQRNTEKVRFELTGGNKAVQSQAGVAGHLPWGNGSWGPRAEMEEDQTPSLELNWSGTILTKTISVKISTEASKSGQL